MTPTVVAFLASACAVAGVVLLVTSANRDVAAMRLVGAVQSLVGAGVATGLAVVAPLLMLERPWGLVVGGGALSLSGLALMLGVRQTVRTLASVDEVNAVFRDVEG